MPYRWRIAARAALVSLAVALAASAGLFLFAYVHYARLIDQKLTKGAFSGTINVYAAPKIIAVGDELTPAELMAELRHGGYSSSRQNSTGSFHAQPGVVEIYPGANSYLGEEPAVVRFARGRIAAIVSLADNSARQQYPLEPQLITNISDTNRDKRRPVRFSQIPPALVHAIVSAEDKRFFEHGGIDFIRLAKAAWVDLRQGRKEQGASTLSMQLARSLWLSPNKNWKRKAAEVLMTLHLEHKLAKQQIFEDYCNEVYLGRRGPFNIDGFGEAARAYFGKDIGQLTLPEAALLAGMVQRPSYYNPFRYPARARDRRNLVLSLMRQNGYLNNPEYLAAAHAPVVLAPTDNRPQDAPYFLDLVNDELQNRLGERESEAYYVYTTLDPDLQRDAEEAVRTGMAAVDRQFRRRKGIPHGQPQVALVALDPHTGEVRALVGGRNYTASQLDHAIAERQPGSAFKPFVYAAALSTAVQGGPHILTPASTVVDQPTTFSFDKRSYEPNNFKGEFFGTVTLRHALAHSLNVATIKVAQEVGYDAVVAMARSCGFSGDLAPTPAIALGAYDATPLEVAGAYTSFANYGEYVEPSLVSLARAHNGAALYHSDPERHRALDPRVAYLMISMLEDVIREGTAAGVRARGFTVPAAGKTGTSRDGWFAGFTSQLLCVVWVGFDDNRDLNLEGARSALPIWTEFMKRALACRPYRDTRNFRRPEGIVTVSVCGDGRLDDGSCSSPSREVFIDGTQPVERARLEEVPEAPPSSEADRSSVPEAAPNPPDPPQIDGRDNSQPPPPSPPPKHIDDNSQSPAPPPPDPAPAPLPDSGH